MSDPFEFENAEVTLSTFTCLSNCAILGPIVWKLYSKQLNHKWLT